MSEQNNFKKNKQSNNDCHVTKKVQRSRISGHFSHTETLGRCLPRSPKASPHKARINSSIESEDTYPIDITLMTGKSKKEGEKK